MTGSPVIESSYHASTHCPGAGVLGQLAVRREYLGVGREGGWSTVTMRPEKETQKVTEAVRVYGARKTKLWEVQGDEMETWTPEERAGCFFEQTSITPCSLGGLSNILSIQVMLPSYTKGQRKTLFPGACGFEQNISLSLSFATCQA